MKKLFGFIMTVLLTVSLISGCSSQSSQAQIVATTLPIYDFTSSLCKDSGLEVQLLVNEPVSCLHNYTLQVSQMKIVEGAEVLVMTGAGYEGFLSDIISTKNTVIDSSAGIDLICSEHTHDHDHAPLESAHHEHESHEHSGHGEHHHHWDGHIWMSPQNAKIMATNICQGLSRKYPDKAPVFQNNLQELHQKLDDLQKYADETLSNLKSRDLITFHDGFHYMADAFGLHIIRSIEEEPGSETSASDLIDLITFVEDHHLPAIFTETNGSHASADIISAETGCTVHSLDMVMYGQGYFDSMYNNIDAIKEALG